MIVDSNGEVLESIDNPIREYQINSREALDRNLMFERDKSTQDLTADEMLMYEKFKFSVFKNMQLMRRRYPYLTGNLAYNSLRIVPINKGFYIFILNDIAPYAEKLENSPKHYRFFERRMLEMSNDVTFDLGGEVIENPTI